MKLIRNTFEHNMKYIRKQYARPGLGPKIGPGPGLAYYFHIYVRFISHYVRIYVTFISHYFNIICICLAEGVLLSHFPGHYFHIMFTRLINLLLWASL